MTNDKVGNVNVKFDDLLLVSGSVESRYASHHCHTAKYLVSRRFLFHMFLHNNNNTLLC